MSDQGQLERHLEGFRSDFEALRSEIGKLVVGQKEAVDGVLIALIAGGHVLLEGAPGTGKTLLVQALAEVVKLSFQRLQCTPDLMPADVIGTYMVLETAQGRRAFEFQRGPLFANILLVDQINRATPKTQSALLEAMEAGSVTVSNETFELPDPFFLAAVQNPLEMEGTFPLPEAQLDRFFFSLQMPLPTAEELEVILDRTTESGPPVTRAVVDGKRLLQMRELALKVPIAPEIRRWGIILLAATHPEHERSPDVVRRFVRYGAGPRAAQAMVLGAKIRAIVDGRYSVSWADLRTVARPALRHRLILNYEGQAENVRPDDLVDRVLEVLPEPAG